MPSASSIQFKKPPSHFSSIANPSTFRLFDDHSTSKQAPIGLQTQLSHAVHFGHGIESFQRPIQRRETEDSLPPNRYGVSLIPPLRNPASDLGRPPLDLSLPRQYPELGQHAQLPPWIWEKIPDLPAKEPFLKSLSRWLTRKLGRRHIARIGGSLANKLGVDKKKTVNLLNDAMIDGGEEGLKELLMTLIEAIAGKPKRIENDEDPRMPSYREFQTPGGPDDELPKPFTINLPPVKF